MLHEYGIQTSALRGIVTRWLHQPSPAVAAIVAARRRALPTLLPPPGHYVAAHVRWGDKLSWKESARLELGLYLQAVAGLARGDHGLGGGGTVSGGGGQGRSGNGSAWVLYLATTSQEAALQMVALAARDYPEVTIVEASIARLEETKAIRRRGSAERGSAGEAAEGAMEGLAESVAEGSVEAVAGGAVAVGLTKGDLEATSNSTSTSTSNSNSADSNSSSSGGVGRFGGSAKDAYLDVFFDMDTIIHAEGAVVTLTSNMGQWLFYHNLHGHGSDAGGRGDGAGEAEGGGFPLRSLDVPGTRINPGWCPNVDVALCDRGLYDPSALTVEAPGPGSVARQRRKPTPYAAFVDRCERAARGGGGDAEGQNSSQARIR